MKQEFRREEALRYLGITQRTLRGWERLGLVDPAQEYTFEQVVAMRALVRLHEAKLPARKIQAALKAVRRTLSEIENPLTELRLYSEGARIRVQVGPHHMEPESGQLLLNFDQAELERMVAMPKASGPQEDQRRSARRKHDAEAHFLRGVELEQTGARSEEAIAAYKRAIELDPDMAPAHVNLGTIYFTAQDWSKASSCYKRAIELNPEYALAHFNLANLYDELGEQESAATHYQSALKLDPNYADAHYNLALLYQSSGHVLKAVRHWRTYLKLDPKSSWAAIAKRELDKLSSTVLVTSPGARS